MLVKNLREIDKLFSCSYLYPMLMIILSGAFEFGFWRHYSLVVVVYLSSEWPDLFLGVAGIIIGTKELFVVSS